MNAQLWHHPMHQVKHKCNPSIFTLYLSIENPTYIYLYKGTTGKPKGVAYSHRGTFLHTMTTMV